MDEYSLNGIDFTVDEYDNDNYQEEDVLRYVDNFNF